MWLLWHKMYSIHLNCRHYEPFSINWIVLSLKSINKLYPTKWGHLSNESIIEIRISFNVVECLELPIERSSLEVPYSNLFDWEKNIMPLFELRTEINRRGRLSKVWKDRFEIQLWKGFVNPRSCLLTCCAYFKKINHLF